ncbi:flexible cuticle protein 12-like [Microplitis mediator]|uniref:flexible cuticle protein 12-like n=1 Tax=Microplitis mediator TaxID=375433 RepID=UPI002552EE67|nr:flexible cuticle protein 12-like [Microplitis mediator]
MESCVFYQTLLKTLLIICIFSWFYLSNMKTIIILVVLASVASIGLSAPQQEITIIRQEENNSIGVGGYHFSYEQSDGQKREETAELENEGTDDEAMKVVGSYSFVAPDGKTYRVDYTADRDGYHPVITLV